MSTPPPIPKTPRNRGSPPKITLEILYDYITESLEKKREERDVKIQIELETLEKRSKERDVKLQDSRNGKTLKINPRRSG